MLVGKIGTSTSSENTTRWPTAGAKRRGKGRSSGQRTKHSGGHAVNVWVLGRKLRAVGLWVAVEGRAVKGCEAVMAPLFEDGPRVTGVRRSSAESTHETPFRSRGAEELDRMTT